MMPCAMTEFMNSGATTSDERSSVRMTCLLPLPTEVRNTLTDNCQEANKLRGRSELESADANTELQTVDHERCG